MGSADWLRMYAQRLEDEHAPHNLSIGMREAANQMDQQRETVLQLLGQVGQLSEEIERLKDGEARLRAEVKVWVNHTKTAVWSDSEECKVLARINAALIETPTVDINVVVPDRDYSAMTPKDCYEAGLLDGVYQAREAIKAAVRAALEGEPDCGRKPRDQA